MTSSDPCSVPDGVSVNSAQVETPDRLYRSRRRGTLQLPEFYDMTVSLIPTAAIVALQRSATLMDFADGDGWVMSHDYTTHIVVCS